MRDVGDRVGRVVVIEDVGRRTEIGLVRGEDELAVGQQDARRVVGDVAARDTFGPASSAAAELVVDGSKIAV